MKKAPKLLKEVLETKNATKVAKETGIHVSVLSQWKNGHTAKRPTEVFYLLALVAWRNAGWCMRRKIVKELKELLKQE